MRLQKLNGLGNDFLVLLDDGEHGPVAPERVVALCDRAGGLGADGLIRSVRVPGPGVQLSFELTNADGSAAEMSGNGARCLGLAAVRAGWWADTDRPCTLDTPAGPRSLSWVGGDALEATLRVDMGPVGPSAAVADLVAAVAEAPAVGPEGVVGVDVGNPHVVALLEGDGLPAADDRQAVVDRAEAVRANAANYELVVRGPEEGALTLAVKERGAGWTQACGTGSVAAAWAAHQRGWVGSFVTVHNPGGSVQVDLSGAEPRLVGPAVFEADVWVASGAEPNGEAVGEPGAEPVGEPA